MFIRNDGITVDGGTVNATIEGGVYSDATEYAKPDGKKTTAAFTVIAGGPITVNNVLVQNGSVVNIGRGRQYHERRNRSG
jgi:hypothetical protein